ncbi:hypothetical protein H8B06_13050 [Sphingobacterium sp. DN00404]|uniref:Methylamine utilisation protein MauE domain-containing protein n=1 Tax=Sphingobacterium micropteri TaxID=2763501 RepID=A0ABR7YQY7_9SPHI|nr:MauE/DoxX family redox-associated membrane protein [Sphingobacterium micropteri]MBD1433760.1 hypothetical protein [Sphingobacterium micropteri]
MKTRIRHITSHTLHIFLMLFWLYVAIDKLWDLPNFHRALLKQPFPAAWASVLYWALPMAELGLALLFVLTRKGYTYLLSAFLMLSFTIYISLGVAGFYAKRPCGCASVFSGLSWGWHLLVNAVLLGLSILGWHLCRQTTPSNSNRIRRKKFAMLFFAFKKILTVPIYEGGFFIRIRFPRRFALFPGRPV